jgi:hypothetical protein
LRSSGFRLSYPQLRHDMLLQGELERTCSPVIEFITEMNSFIKLATSPNKLSHQSEDGLYLCRHLDRLPMMLKPVNRKIYNFIDVFSYWYGRRLQLLDQILQTSLGSGILMQPSRRWLLAYRTRPNRFRDPKATRGS